MMSDPERRVSYVYMSGLDPLRIQVVFNVCSHFSTYYLLPNSPDKI